MSMYESLIFGKIKYVKDEIVTSTGFTNATPQRKVLFIDRVTGQSNGFEGVITKVMYNQSINSTSINTCVMQSTIETRVVKVGDFVIIKEEYILYKGNPFEHVFIFLSINVSSTQGQVFLLNQSLSNNEYYTKVVYCCCLSNISPIECSFYHTE